MGRRRTTAAAAASTPHLARVAVFEEGRRIEVDGAPDLDAVARSLAAHEKRVAVVAYDRPDASHVREIAERLSLHPVLVEDLLHARQRPKIERYGDALFLVMRAVGYLDEAEDVVVSEFHVVVQGQWVIVLRQGEPGAPDWRPEQFRQDPALLAHGTEAVLYTVIDTIVDTYFPVLDGVGTDLDEIEGQVFTGDTAAPERIYRLGREVIDLQRAAVPLQAVITELIAGFEKYNTKAELQTYLRDVSDHLARITSRVAEIRELLTQILTVNATLVGQRQNEDMKRISSWAAILFAPTLIGAIYGMNFRDMPELHWAFGYPMALAAMLLLGVVLYLVFKRKHWM
ncbi:magnesium transporter [Paramicrobacterium humi]|uniref:Magnesium transporter n=1 Tax=Paramicrobacterium humi TaxID=640635 RepID=A0A1H4MV77_9MICO|nr:magnesium and cobalt transport protein CorA [Microbacterium humi]SEB86727.1 magnesium transporter [Microbacterium humi]